MMTAAATNKLTFCSQNSDKKLAEFRRLFERNFEKKNQIINTPSSGASAQEVPEPAWVY